ncbi:MAG TPA: FtsW/RodA/SpoVE family cell cycle protein, partial [Verrucomicrobiae bacterium]|nr:FtsW/RodA/SpoVE family cell cycle protein [Verrucomicrobiae bacterium]
MYESSLNVRHTRFDWGLLLGLLGLMIIGGLFIYSATAATDQLNGTVWYRHRIVTQVGYYVFGSLVAVCICAVDYRILCRWSLVAYWLTIIALVAVLLPFIGKKVLGARRWIDFGFYQFQPSEFVKLSLIFALAHFLSRPADELRLPGVFWKALAMIGLPFLLVMAEPDLGSALVLFPTGLAMMYAAG